MKSIIQYTLAASLVAGSAASHQHQHQHFHAKKNVDKRQPDAAVAVVAGPTATAYVLDGVVLTEEEAKKGLSGGNFVVVGETVPTYVAPPPPPPPSTTAQPTTTSSAEMGAQFIESAAPTTTTTTSSSSSVAPPPPPKPKTTTSAAPPPPPPSPKPKAKPQPQPAAAPPTGQGLTSDFPSGTIKCSEFPSDYGAVALDWLNLGGWASVQEVPDYTAESLTISNIIGGSPGKGCPPQSMCSYACPPGYQKTQWPKAQGATKQSIGGLFCNSDGFLELTRSDASTLCEQGMGGVTVQNDLDEEVVTCRTDYPGDESMVIPAIAQPGGTVALCNPDQNTYYQWQGLATSAQYYVNKKGYSVEDSCVWTSPKDPEGAGNWSPINLGVGMTADGTTFLSIFQNLPTSNAKLDFNIEITGDVNSKCSYIDGQWTGGSTGCTTGMAKGGSAVIRYF